MSETLLRDIAEFRRNARMRQLTFGRLAVNDGKLVGAYVSGGRVTGDTRWIACAPSSLASRITS